MCRVGQFSGFQQFIESSRVSTGSRRLVSLAGVIEGFRGWMQSYETNTMYSGHDVAILMTGSEYLLPFSSLLVRLYQIHLTCCFTCHRAPVRSMDDSEDETRQVQSA